MKSRWNDEDAALEGDDVGVVAYASRLIGAEPALVLAGGGNSSVKTVATDLFGEEHDVLHVKGSGADMASLRRDGFAPLRLAAVARLAELPALSDARMAIELRAASLDPGAPAPSVESILHAVLPDRFVLHTHADAVLALSNTPAGADLAAEVYGDRVVVVPYVMPGFDLARGCAARLAAERHDATIGMVLLHHGLFTFAADARAAYENHVDLVGRALARAEAAGPAPVAPPPEPPPSLRPLPAIRRHRRRRLRRRRPGRLPPAGDVPAGHLEAVAELRRRSRPPRRPLVVHTSATTPAGASPPARPRPRSARSGRRPPTTCCAPSGCRWSGADVGGVRRAATAAYVERNRDRLGPGR